MHQLFSIQEVSRTKSVVYFLEILLVKQIQNHLSYPKVFTLESLLQLSLTVSSKFIRSALN